MSDLGRGSAVRSSPPPWRHSRLTLAVAAITIGAAAQVRISEAVAAQWVEPPGKAWSALAVYHQDTRDHFGVNGAVRPFFADGHAVATSSFLTTAIGLAPHVDLWTQLSFHRLRYDDIAGARASTGVGDARMWLRVAPLAMLHLDIPFAVRGGAKAPVGDFDVNAEIIPLGDGQPDWEIMAELGHSFWPRSLYLSGWVGYRWREENTESRKDFGNEVFYFAQLGGHLGAFGYKLALDGWNGAAGVTEGIAVPSFRRQLVQIQPSLTYNVGAGQFEAGARFALRGRNLPAGTALMAQYFRRWESF